MAPNRHKPHGTVQLDKNTTPSRQTIARAPNGLYCKIVDSKPVVVDSKAYVYET